MCFASGLRFLFMFMMSLCMFKEFFLSIAAHVYCTFLGLWERPDRPYLVLIFYRRIYTRIEDIGSLLQWIMIPFCDSMFMYPCVDYLILDFFHNIYCFENKFTIEVNRRKLNSYWDCLYEIIACRLVEAHYTCSILEREKEKIHSSCLSPSYNFKFRTNISDAHPSNREKLLKYPSDPIIVMNAVFKRQTIQVEQDCVVRSSL
jgi:hypothetical protein